MLQTSTTHAVVGGSVFLSYALIREVLRHHQDTLRRPKVIDHLIASTLLGGVGSAFVFNGALQTVILNGSVVGFTGGLITWYLSLVMSHTKHSNIPYENGVSEEEKARFEAQD